MSELALELIREAKEKRLTTLDLSNCGLTELPEELFELNWLESICFSIGIPEAWFECPFQYAQMLESVAK